MARRSRPVLYEVVRRGERQRHTGWFSRLISSLRGGDASRDANAEDDQDYPDAESMPADTFERPVPPPETEIQSSLSASSSTSASSSSKATGGAAERRSAVESHPAPLPERPVAAPPPRHASAESPRLAPRHDPTPTLAFPEPIQAAADPWQFTLNRSSLIAAGLGVLLLMFIAFEIGRGTAGPSVASTATTDDTSSTALPNNTSRSQTRSTQVTAKTNRNNDSVALPEDHQASRTTEEEPLQPDTRGAIESVPHGRYLVVQDLAAQKNRSRRMDDGRRIVEHLESKGIAAKLIQPGRKAPHVIIAAPLDGMSDAAIENLKARVRRAGNDFPDYDFSSCYPASF